MQTPTDLAKQVKTHFDNGDFEALMKVINEALKRSDSHPDAGAQLRQAQQNLEDEKLREEFEIHVENLKNEAMKQFDQELYGECLGTFRFLCELEPDNRTLRDYLELCRQLAQGDEEKVPGKDGAVTPTFPAVNRSFEEPPLPLQSPAGPAFLERTTASGPWEASGLHNNLENSERQVSSSEPDAKGSSAKTSEAAREPATKSVTSGLRLRLLAVIVLLVVILGIGYLKRPWRSWNSLPETRSSAEKTAGDASEPGRTAAQLDPQTFWLQKAESAVSSGQYVSPGGDNAVAYCNQVLVLAPESQKARSLKEESINKAVAQAKKSIESNRFAEADEVYSSLLRLSQQESHFPLTTQEVENELEKLEFAVYPVVHDHLFGSCKGHLEINAYVISFVPSGDSKDGFTEPFAEVTLFRPNDKLKIEIRAKTYRFESNLGSKEGNRERVMAIFRDLKRRMAKEG